jgi:hypothetical protein
MRPAARSGVVSSFTLIKGAMIDETWTAFLAWDLGEIPRKNLERICADNPFNASVNWRRDIRKVLNRRIDPQRDAALIRLAQAGIDRHVWNPLLLWHITRDEFLLREFLTTFLWDRFDEGALQTDTGEVLGWLMGVEKSRNLVWTDSTRKRVAAGLLGIAVDFGLMEGSIRRRFLPYHLPDQSLLYLLHAVTASQANARRVLDDPDWRIFRLRPEDLERDLLRLHQLHRLHFDVAGSLTQLRLPAANLDAFVAEMTA